MGLTPRIMKRNKVPCFVLLVSLTHMVVGQVDHSIDQDEDLLAVDSIDNEVSFIRPILPPPPVFAKIGARLSAAPLSAGKGAAIVQNSKMNTDGSYAFNYETNDGVRRQESGLGINRTTDEVYTTPSKGDHDWTIDHDVFKDRPAARCYTKDKNSTMSDKCPTCYSIITDKVNSGFNAAGGLGLFFSFTELFGGIVACRYRNLMDPLASGLTGTPFAGGI